jgi:uncharacterized membrane protein YfcA
MAESVLILIAASVLAGLVGALAGLGGGVLIVPLLTIGFGVDIRYAIGASIISVIATSSGAAAVYVRDRLTNLRLGMVLELATTAGAVGGALLAGVVDPQILFLVFGSVLAVSVVPLVARLGEELPAPRPPDGWARRLRLAASYADANLGRVIPYAPTRLPLGLAMMGVAGLLSGLLGIGSGTLKVLAMDTAMRLPMKVSTTTSNFMIGVTAAASAGIYFSRGDINPLLAAPVALGVVLGAGLGSRLLAHLSNRALRRVFVPVMLLIAAEMVLRGMGVRV